MSMLEAGRPLWEGDSWVEAWRCCLGPTGLLPASQSSHRRPSCPGCSQLARRLSVPDLACRGGGVQLFISAVFLWSWPLCWFQPPGWGRDSGWEKSIEGQITDENKINPTWGHSIFGTSYSGFGFLYSSTFWPGLLCHHEIFLHAHYSRFVSVRERSPLPVPKQERKNYSWMQLCFQLLQD